MILGVPILKHFRYIFSLHVRMYRKRYCTTSGIGEDKSISKMFLCDGQDADRRAIIYLDRSCCFAWDKQK